MSAEKDAGLTQKILRSAKTEHGTKAIPNGRPEIQPRNTTNPTDRTRGFQTWKKNGELKQTKATHFAISKMEGPRNYTRARKPQFNSSKGQTEHCAGEIRGANWVRMDPEYVLWTLDAIEMGISLRPVYGEWRMEGDREVVWGASASLASFDSFESWGLYPCVMFYLGRAPGNAFVECTSKYYT